MGELTEMENTKVELEKELKTPFQSQLSNEEKNELSELNKQIIELQENYIRDNNERTSAETSKDKLQNLLSANLLKQQEELQSKLESNIVVESKSNLEQHQSELRSVKESFDIANRRYT